jgi:hypothetical protein
MIRLTPVHLYLAAAAALLALGGCSLPPDYSPNYSYIAVPAPTAKHPGRVEYVLAADACLMPDPTAAIPTGPLLPAGCANAYNLQRMADREHDLVEGRKLGRAPAAPSARAAEIYLYGRQGPLGAAAAKPGGGGGGQPPTTTQEEAAPSPSQQAPK